MSSELFKKYYSRLAKEGLLKSILCGLIIGFLALTISSAIFLLMGWKSFWVCFIVFAFVAASTSVAFYKLKFQPTTKAIARRVDELGLEERIITMTELEGDESYIAMRQREDALQALNTVHAGLVKIVVSAPLIIAVAFSALAGIGMTTVTALATAGVIPSGAEIINPEEGEPETKFFEVVYEVQEGNGMIEGEIFQVVEEGFSTTGVLAVADDEWVFVSWSDGLENPYREEYEVRENLTIYAVFQPLEEGQSGSGMPGGEGDEGEGGEGDQPADQPGEGNGDGDGDGEPTDQKSEGGSGKYEEVNQVLDGKTYYGDKYDEAYDEAMEEVNSGEYDNAEKDMTGGYLDGIETGRSDKQN